jgi:fused signal recognition particle receptor
MKSNLFRKITLFSLLLALIVVVSGAYLRSSGAQLACPDWPTCYGQVFISDANQFTAQAALAFPEQTVDIAHVWQALSHRYLNAILAAMATVIGLLSWREKSYRLAAVTASVALLMLTVCQAASSFWLVKLHAMPVVATAHTVLTMSGVWMLFWLYLRSNPAIAPLKKPAGSMMCLFGTLVLLAQIVLGAWVGSNHAGLACTGFPQCNGQWWVDADYQSALNLLAGLFSGYSGDLAYELQAAINSLHRLMALVAFIMLTAVAWLAMSGDASKQTRAAGFWLSLLLFAEIALGVVGGKLGHPLWAVLAHHAIAVLLMLPLIAIRFYSRYGIAEVGQPAIEQPQPTGLEGVYVEPAAESLYLRLKSQLKRTRSGLGGLLAGLPVGQKGINNELLEELETRLLMADIGITVTTEIISQLTQRLERHQLQDGEALVAALKQELLAILTPCNEPLHIPKQGKPFVILVVGVNGAGKTTTIGKLANRLQAQGHSVMLAAGDTFRAAAVEQLQAWGERNHIHVVAQHTGADSASVIYDGVQSAQAKGIDVLIADTAGRLHTKSNLMDELKKVKRIIGKLDDTAPHEVLLVLDAGTGQNALSQAKLFNEALTLTGLVLTKLDGTAKGGVIFALAKQAGIPIRFIGIGEGIGDLQDFDAENFVNALFVKD